MKMRSTIKSCTIFSLVILSISLAITTTIAQSTCSTHTFNNNQQFSSCNDLPELSSFLYWNYDSATRTANIAFRATGVNPTSNWIAWALNPTGSGMIGAQSLVAYQNSSSRSVHAYTSSVTSTQTTLAPSSLSFQVDNISATSGTNEMTIFATIRPPSTTVNQVWQVGPVSGGSPGQHSLNGANTRSSGSINFLSGQATSSGAVVQRRGRKNVHGVLNAISWGILMPLGAIIARYVKVFPTADPAWFYLHVSCQIVAYILGVAGWGTGLKLGSDSPGIVYHVHRNIGIALFCLATLQVFALLLRPNKDHKYRLYWKVYHHGIGYIVIILSIINIYQGFDKVLQPEKKWKRIYSGIIIALGAIALVLEAFTWSVVLKKKKDEQAKHGHHANGTNGFANSYA